MESITKAFDSQQERLLFYSPYNFLRELGGQNHLDYLRQELQLWIENKPDHLTFETQIDSENYIFLYRFLAWDSSHFGIPTFKLFLVLYPEKNFTNLFKAVSQFCAHLKARFPLYFFCEIPAEDSFLLQAFTTAGFRLTETRLNFYRNQVKNFNYERFPVRAATQNDIPLVRKTAAENRNNFDRYHADIFFTQEQADNYLATYAEACINKISDLVIIPNEKGQSNEAFMAISRLEKDAKRFSTSFARILLTAVSPKCKGWHLKLASETIQQAKEWNSQYVLMTTQATNRAVFRTAEKLDFKLGSTTHLLSLTF